MNNAVYSALLWEEADCCCASRPCHADEGSDEEDDDVADPDFIPPAHNLDTPCPSDIGLFAKRKCVRPAAEELEDEDDYDYNDDNNNVENEDEDQPAPQVAGLEL